MQLDPRHTALILIDLQNGILSQPIAPYSADEVVARANVLAGRFRAAAAPVVLVNVGWSAEYADALKQPVDQPANRPASGLPPEWSELVSGLAQAGDVHITKRQWGAFTGTELDLQLRRRGIDTIVLGGVATNFGVESTARFGWEFGYRVVIAEDVCSSFNNEMHQFSITTILPRIAQVRRSEELGFDTQAA